MSAPTVNRSTSVPDGRDRLAVPPRASASAAQRLPAAPRDRRPALVALAVLLIMGGAAAAGLLALRLDDREAVLVTARALAPGDRLTAADFAVSAVAADGVDLVPAERVEDLIGRYVTEPVPAGRLVDFEIPVSAEDITGSGDAFVGVALQPGHLPAEGLHPGDLVQMILTGDGDDDLTLLGLGTVSKVVTASDEGITAGADTVLLTLNTTSELSPRVARAAAGGSLALVRIKPPTAGEG